MRLTVGSTLGHYQVVAPLGAGGMGEVYRATDTKLRRDVALKVLPVDVTTDPGRLDRFKGEARAVAALNHPNIVTIYSVEEAEGVHFLTMELVTGRTVEAVCAGGVTSLDGFLDIALPLAEAVAAAHATGITHRDLKPQNVMVGRDGRVKVLDFGLAKFAELDDSDPSSVERSTMIRTQEGVAVGTVPYMSPEHIEGRGVGAWSDIFSLGAMFYEMATGARPFQGPSALAVMASILRDQPPPLAGRAPALTAVVHDIIHRCLAKAPAARFPNGTALHAALREARQAANPRPGAAPTLPSRPRPGSPPLVGRQAEQGTLAGCLQAAAGGQGALVLLGGEPGVGKTRLAEELLSAAQAAGMLALTGRCYEAGTSPFAPFAEMFDQLLREVPADSLRLALGDDAPDLARLLPRMRRLWPDIREASQLEPDQQRRVLFNAVLDSFRRLSAQRPLVVLLDDVHWADEGSVGLLQHLAPHLSTVPVLVLGTYRDVDVDPGRPFEQAMATLVRHRHGVRVAVRRLPHTAVAELLTAFAGSPAPAAWVDSVFQQTEGNPFFIGEVFKHLSEEGRVLDESGRWRVSSQVDTAEVPEGVRLVIGRRLARLTDATQTMLTTAAVVGRQFDLPLVETLCRFEGETFLEAIDQAEGAKLIAAERAGRQTRYAFTHELLRSTLLGALSLPRRQRLHARVADAMEALVTASPARHAAAIAHQLLEAGPVADEARTIRFLTLASDHAMEAGAIESGLEHLERALSLVQDDAPDIRAALLWKSGLARRALGQLTAAIDDWAAALALREGGGDDEAIVTLCQELAHSYVWTAQPALGVAAAQRGLTTVGPEASSSRCRLLGSLAWSLSMAGDFAAADPLMIDALAMANTLGDVQRGELLLLCAWHYYLCMRRREQADACREAAVLLRPTRDLARIGEALASFQMACIQIGRPRDIARTEQETRTLAERLGRFDLKVLHCYAEALRDWLIAGDLDRLDRGLAATVDVAGAWRWMAEGSQAQARLWRGHLDAATAQAQIAFSHEPPVGTLTGIGWGMVFLCECAAGRREPALTLLNDHAAALPRPGQLNTIGSWTALFKVIEGLAIIGERARAAALYPLAVEALATESVVTFDASHLLETVAGIAAAAGGHRELAATHFQTAIRLADEMPFKSEQAEARYWYARTLADWPAPDRTQMRGLLEAALTIYGMANMPWHVERTDALLADTCP